MSDEFVENLKKPSAWLRVLFMAGFVLALYVAGVILLVLMLAQILFSLITGEDNSNLRRLGGSLTLYVSQILEFLTYNRDDKPFPFAQFPLTNADEVDDVTTADTGEAAAAAAPAAGSETAAESAAQVMAESAARRATKATSRTPKSTTGKSTGKSTAKSTGKKPAAGKASAKKTSTSSPEMGVTDAVDRQAKDV